MSRKLCEKPNSIEELTEKRDWMKQIPEHLKSYKVHIDSHELAISVVCHIKDWLINKSYSGIRLDSLFNLSTTGAHWQDPV